MTFASAATAVVGTFFSVTPQVFERGAAITACVSTPSLPVGLAFDQVSCAVSGTPLAAQAASTYSVRATNAAGAGPAFALQLTVAGGVPSVGGYSPSTVNATYGSPLTIVANLNTNGAALTACSGTGVPTGLSIDPATCNVTGTPSAAPGTYSLSIIATNSAGRSAPAALSIVVAAGLPSLSFSPATQTANFGVAYSYAPALSPNGSAITGCSVTPALSANRSFNASNCAISGTPNAAATATDYAITVTNGAGSATFTFNLSVAAATPTLTYASASLTATALSTFSVTPTLAENGAAVATALQHRPDPAPRPLHRPQHLRDQRFAKHRTKRSLLYGHGGQRRRFGHRQLHAERQQSERAYRYVLAGHGHRARRYRVLGRADDQRSRSPGYPRSVSGHAGVARYAFA